MELFISETYSCQTTARPLDLYCGLQLLLMLLLHSHDIHMLSSNKAHEQASRWGSGWNKQKQTGKPNEFLQSNRPSLQDLPHRLYSLLINWFPSIMWWGACSQANVSMYCCTYAIVACIYKQHRNSKQAFLRLKLTGHIKKPRFPLISILVST